MTLSTDTNRADHDGDGSTTVFAYQFRVDAEGDMVVYIDDTIQVGGYTVQDVGEDSGGTVTFNTAPTSDETVVLLRVIDYTQVVDYDVYDRFPESVHENALDRIVMQIQQLAEIADRSITLGIGEEGTAAEFIALLEDAVEAAEYVESQTPDWELVADLTPQLGANLDMGDHLIEGVAAAELAYLIGVSANIQTQINACVKDTGAEDIAGVKTFGSFPITPGSAPTTNYQVANKKYADDVAETAENAAKTDSANTSLSDLTAAGNTQLCRAWINFEMDGIPSIVDDYNISGVTDLSTGKITITIDDNLTTVTYAPVAGGYASTSIPYIAACHNLAAGSYRIHFIDHAGADADPGIAHSAIFGD